VKEHHISPRKCPGHHRERAPHQPQKNALAAAVEERRFQRREKRPENEEGL